MSRRENGFTLVEMLVSLAVLALVGAMLAGAVHSIAGWMIRDDAAIAEREREATARAVLRDRIEQLRPVLRLDSADPDVDADGDEGTFTFVAPAMARAAPDALWRYRISTSAVGRLTLYWASSLNPIFGQGRRDMTGWRAVTLLDGVETARLDYFGTDPRGKLGRRWQTQWGRRAQPPDLVRVRVVFRDRTRPPFEDLVVRPRATVNAACRIDALSGRCEART